MTVTYSFIMKANKETIDKLIDEVKEYIEIKSKMNDVKSQIKLMNVKKKLEMFGYDI